MTTYTETFTGQTTGSNSTSFTDRYDAESNVSIENPALGEQDDRVLRFNTGDSGFIFQSMDAIDSDGNRDNCEILARFQVATDAAQEFVLVGRASGSGGSETCYSFKVNASGYFQILRNDSGTPTNVAQGIQSDDRGQSPGSTKESPWITWRGDDFNMTPDDVWLYARFRINGTGATVTLSAKVWYDGQPEPSSWTLTGTDTSGSRITTAGWCGVAKEGFSGATYYDFVSVGTNGDTAPVTDSTDPIRLTTVNAHILQQDETGPIRLTTVNAHVLYTVSPERIGAAQTVVAMINTGLD